MKNMVRHEAENSIELDALEGKIAGLKSELSELSRSRRQTLESQDMLKHIQIRAKQVEKTLDNCESISKYVAKFSPPIAAKLMSEHDRIRKELGQMRTLDNDQVFHEWIRHSFAPAVKFSEQMAYLVATCYRTTKQGRVSHYRWTLKR
ncbi:MAG: hypothetical protein JRN68_00870 [Nitrososphaerota archaeon]|nr:hypothetical protein [Nitrososphaerota archaeon]